MKVLFVQEQPTLMPALKLTLENRGFGLVVCNGTLNPHSVIDAVHPDIVIADITKERGLSYVKEAKSKNLPVMVLSSHDNDEKLQAAFEKGADDYITMPLSLPELALRVSLLTKTGVTHAA